MPEADKTAANSRWLTYEEAGRVLGGLSPEAVRALARRRKWPRQSPNLPGGRARVLVPEMTGVDQPGPALPDGHMTGVSGDRDRAEGGRDRAVIALQEANAALRDQLDRAETRIAYLDAERRRLFDLLLGDRRPWWRRWFR